MLGLGLSLWTQAILGGSFNPLSLFANGTYPGFLFDNLDPTKTWGNAALPLLWRDQASSLVTGTGQGVGMFLDRSQGVAVGASITQPFAVGGAGWSVTGADATHIVTFGAGTCRIQSDTTSPVLQLQSVANLVSGKLYRITIPITAWVSGSIKFDQLGGSQGVSAAVGTYTFFFIAGGAGTIPLNIYRNSANVDLTLGNITCQPVAGNQALQATSGSRPAWTAATIPYLNLDGVDDWLVSPLLPASDMTVAFCFRLSTANCVIFGARSGANRSPSLVSQQSTGFLAVSGGAESLSVATILSSYNAVNVDTVALIRSHGLTSELWINGLLAASGTNAGTTQNTVPIGLGAQSVAGVYSSGMTGRIYRMFGAQRYIPDAAVVPLMRSLGKDVVSF